MQIQIETDATNAGPKGKVEAFIYDCNGTLLAKVASAEIGRGGKHPGIAVRNTFQATFIVGPEIGSQACKVVVVPYCTVLLINGSVFQLKR
jgi:hypothetical protein